MLGRNVDMSGLGPPLGCLQSVPEADHQWANSDNQILVQVQRLGSGWSPHHQCGALNRKPYMQLFCYMT